MCTEMQMQPLTICTGEVNIYDDCRYPLVALNHQSLAWCHLCTEYLSGKWTASGKKNIPFKFFCSLGDLWVTKVTKPKINNKHTTFTCPTEYKSIIVNTIIAKRMVKLCDRSHNIHLSRAASISMRIDAIQMNAVKNSNSNMNVRGNTATCNAVLSISSSKLQTNSPEKPASISFW